MNEVIEYVRHDVWMALQPLVRPTLGIHRCDPVEILFTPSEWSLL